jgi:glucokinase
MQAGAGMLLAGDVGGTKVRMALFEPNKNLVCKKEMKYKSREWPNLFSLIQDFLKNAPHDEITSLCVGVAGPVINGRCQETNIPWIIDAEELKHALKISRGWVINDLEANAWGLGLLEKEELLCLNRGQKTEGNQALISAGTGLGEAGLYWDGFAHRPFSCEGGHASFAPTNEEEIELLRYLLKKYSHVSYERILSGSGLYQLYRFLIDTKREEADPDIARLPIEEEPQKLITEKALNGTSAACARALHLFISIYGAEAGNLALKLLSLGGLFIGGGIAPRLAPLFTKSTTFMHAFKSKGRFAELLDKIPVHIVLDERTALLGAARYAQEREHKRGKAA